MVRKTELQPVIHSDDSILRFHFTLTKHEQLERVDHGHLFTRHSASTNLFSEHEKRSRKSLLSVRTVHGRLVDQRSLAFCCQHLPFLSVNTNIGVHTQAQQSYHHIQLGVRTTVVEWLRMHAFIWKASIAEKIFKLKLGL